MGLGDVSETGFEEATMWYSTRVGETRKRTLAQDDKDGISALY